MVALLTTTGPCLLSAPAPPSEGQEAGVEEPAVHALSMVISRSFISPKTLWRLDWLGTPISTTWHSWKGAQVTYWFCG